MDEPVKTEKHINVKVVDVDIKFSTLVMLLVKLAFASIPAAIIVILLSSWFTMMFYGIVKGL